ncbi:MAG: Bro-N domain-containing protein, partial [Verrucomicrobiales bacterium]|nr:Bro-N domain-containing protein [Verrucomicrobiales bacterium]
MLWDPHGEPHFIGVEVARALGYQNPSSALYQHLGGGVSKSDTPTPSGAQNCTIITFNQLLLLVSRSTLPAARKFQEWVRDEVLLRWFSADFSDYLQGDWICGERGREGERERGREGERVRGSEGQRVRGSEGQRVRGSEGQRVRGSEGQRVRGSEG